MRICTGPAAWATRSGYVAHQILLSRGNRLIVEAADVNLRRRLGAAARQGHASPITMLRSGST